jgi:hypothetical protein
MKYQTLDILTLMLSVISGNQEIWQFVYVNRSTELSVTSGLATLQRDQVRLRGELVGVREIRFLIDARISGSRATATFGALESDDGGTRMTGTFRQMVIPAPGGISCWQTLQLSDGFSSLTLARNAARCEPEL